MGIGVAITAVILVGAVVWGYMMRPDDAPCRSIEYIISDRGERMYFAEGELSLLLQSEGISPVGEVIDRALLHRIEQAIRRHPMVRTAECYATPRNELKVRITQRVPLLKVQNPGDTYFIDTDRRWMEARMSVRDSVLLVSGAVGVQTAATTIADFALWLQTNRYWNGRIQSLHMASPINAIVYVGGRRVVLGTIDGYERKLNKLHTFIEKSPQEILDQHYTELDLRFKGQVIGRK